MASNAPELELQAAVDSIPADAVALMRAHDGTIVYVNEPWEDMFGYAPGEAVGRHISIADARDDALDLRRANDIPLALDRRGVWQGDVHNVRKDGSLFWTHCEVSRFEHAEHGTVWVALNRDISVRNASGGDPRAALERFRTIFERSPAGMAIVGPDLVLVDANDALAELTGHHHDELVGTACAALVEPADAAGVATFLTQRFAGKGVAERVEARGLWRSDPSVPVALSMTVVRSPDARPLYGIAVLTPTGS